MYVKSTKVRSGKKSYEYLYRDQAGRVRQRTLFRLGEVAMLRESGELDRVVEALTAHAQRRWVDADEVEAQATPAIGGSSAGACMSTPAPQGLCYSDRTNPDGGRGRKCEPFQRR